MNSLSMKAPSRRIAARKIASSDHPHAAFLGEASHRAGGAWNGKRDTIEILRAKLASLEANQHRMAKANDHVRRENRDALAAMGFSASAIDALLKPDHRGRNGYAPYEMQNNNANIRRLRSRIAELERIDDRESVDIVAETYEYHEDAEQCRVVFLFQGKPGSAGRELMNRHGFKWTSQRDSQWAYARELSQAAVNAARYIRAALDASA